MEFLPHLLPLLTLPEGVVSSTVETLPPEWSTSISLLFLALPLASLALPLLFGLWLNRLDYLVGLVLLHCVNNPLFLLIFIVS